MTRASWILPIAMGATTLVVFHLVGWAYHASFVVDLGRRGGPAPEYGTFLGYWLAFGSVAAGFVAVGAARALHPRSFRIWPSASNGRFIAAGAVLAFAAPAAFRHFVLEDAPLTDDEGSYRFMAELIAGGRLTLPTRPHKEFYDRIFMINDHRYYAQYFVGWPALMAPFARFQIPGLANPFYNALAVLPLFDVVRRTSGEPFARAAVFFYVTAPFVVIGAATQMSHTSCMFALLCATAAFVRLREAHAPRWLVPAFSVAFCTAVFIRPLSAFGIGLPLVAIWTFETMRSGPRRFASLAAFAVPAIVLGGLFLYVNHAQNGSPFVTAYKRYQEYVVQNRYQFTTFGSWDITAVPGMSFEYPHKWVATTAVALYRLNFAVFGWPVSLLFVALAWKAAGSAWAWSSLACFLAMHCTSTSIGVDSFGPVHYFETIVPILVLSAYGLRRSMESARRLSSAIDVPWVAALPAALVFALPAVTWPGYWTVRASNLRRISENVTIPEKAAKKNGITHAVVFSPRHFAPNCLSKPTRHFINFRPENDPDLENDILWVNDLGAQKNWQLLHDFPDRKGYVLAWKEPCRVVFEPVTRPAPGDETGSNDTQNK